jgi:hypothetical protein
MLRVDLVVSTEAERDAVRLRLATIVDSQATPGSRSVQLPHPLLRQVLDSLAGQFSVLRVDRVQLQVAVSGGPEPSAGGQTYVICMRVSEPARAAGRAIPEHGSSVAFAASHDAHPDDAGIDHLFELLPVEGDADGWNP